jgi:hypothetical protein
MFTSASDWRYHGNVIQGCRVMYTFSETLFASHIWRLLGMPYTILHPYMEFEAECSRGSGL